MAHSRRLMTHPRVVRLNAVTVSVANADQSMLRISSIDFTYLISFVVASDPHTTADEMALLKIPFVARSAA
jgi:hypothetical protein